MKLENTLALTHTLSRCVTRTHALGSPFRIELSKRLEILVNQILWSARGFMAASVERLYGLSPKVATTTAQSYSMLLISVCR